MMTYQQASEFISTPFIYTDVTQDEIDAVTSNKFVTTANGVILLGVSSEIKSLENKLLVPAVVADEDAV